MPPARIAALNVYPVKSCRGVACERAQVTARGLAFAGVGDREWMIVDGAGRFLTQREHPRLARVVAAVEAGCLTLNAPGLGALVVPVTAAVRDTRDVVVWGSTVRAHDTGDANAARLSSWLGMDVRLVRFDPTQRRVCNPEFAGDSGAHTAFADGYPVLVIGEGSLAELNRRLAANGEPALPMNRFRPNVVLAGLDAHDEDHVDTIGAGDVRLRLVKPCTRCRITTTNQDTAEVGSEPLRTLGGYRSDDRLGGVTFGMNAIVEAGTGRELAVGAPVSCSYRF